MKIELETIYEPPVMTFENIHEHCSTIATGLYRCIKCTSKDIDKLFIIKYGLHHWFLCKKCSSKLLYLVRNDDALKDVDENYGRWEIEFIKHN